MDTNSSNYENTLVKALDNASTACVGLNGDGSALAILTSKPDPRLIVDVCGVAANPALLPPASAGITLLGGC
jgi:hypothetical protein